MCFLAKVLMIKKSISDSRKVLCYRIFLCSSLLHLICANSLQPEALQALTNFGNISEHLILYFAVGF